MSKHTNEQIATDFNLWMEYADPSGLDSEDDFNTKTTAEKVAFLESCGFSDDEE